MTFFYKAYNKWKVDDVDHMLTKYAGQEQKLYATMFEMCVFGMNPQDV